ncbi:unnamed protein product [Ostreobium quekettii]|uniref:Mediator of RNA polymerase II transcription subunit 14 n=1 Tax=Ostreobium quekettii TaxID=121088 RepID=A0A8S1IP93_9CHLO|nr:unnamed protein product [Ostreobium quekettii]|eukprot:evm.model.scf_58.10 EVM.evm.TU.scf_58.10   scf_58:93902-106452(-)
MADPAPPDGATYQATIKLNELAERLVHGAYSGLQDVLQRLPSMPEADRPIELLQYLHQTRQQLLRLRMATQWANKAKAVNTCARAWGVAGQHSDSFRAAADSLAYLHEELQEIAIPAYDVHTAWETLTTGSYSLLPLAIEELRPPKLLPPNMQHAALRHINYQIHSKLDGVTLPEGLELIRISRGTATLMSKGEYEVKLTLVKTSRQPPDLQEEGREGSKAGFRPKEETNQLPNAWWWRLLELKLFTGSAHGPPLLPETLALLQNEIDARMWRTAELSDGDAMGPIDLMHQILREVCGRLLISFVRKSCRRLVAKGGPWEGQARLAVAAVLNPGYRMYYWEGVPFISSDMLQGKQPDANKSSPYLEVGTVSSGRISVQHFPPLPSDYVREPVELALNPLEADVELVMLQAAAVNAQVILGVLCHAVNEHRAGKKDFSKHFSLLYWRENFEKMKGQHKRSQRQEAAVSFGPKELGSPVLECYGGGHLLLCVTLHLQNGRLLLHLGPYVKDNTSTELAATVHAEEGSINQRWRRWAREPSVNPNVVQRVAALGKVAGKLWTFVNSVQEHCFPGSNTLLLYAANLLSLDPCSPVISPVLWKKYLARHPECPAPRNNDIQLAFPAAPFPRSFPPLVRQADKSQRVPQSGRRTSSDIVRASMVDVRFYLRIAGKGVEDRSYLLVIMGVDAAGMPVEVLKCIPFIPQPDELPAQGILVGKECSMGGGKGKEDLRRGIKRAREDDEDSHAAKAQRSSEDSLLSVSSSPGLSLPSLSDVEMEDVESAPKALQGGNVPGLANPDAGALMEVVRWCHKLIVRESLLLQLQALDLPYMEEYRHQTSGELRWCVWLTGGNGTGGTDSDSPTPEASTLADVGPVELQIPNDSPFGLWTAHITSSQLSDTIRSCTALGDTWGDAVSLVPEGVALKYHLNKGQTVLALVQHLQCIAATQAFIRQLRLLERTGASGLCFDWPKTGRVTVEQIGLSHVALACEDAASAHVVKYTVAWSPWKEGSSKQNRKRQQQDGHGQPNAGRKQGRSNFNSDEAAGIRCSVSSSEAGIPTEVLREYALMVEAGEGGLFLDAIGITSGPLVQLVAALASSDVDVAEDRPATRGLIPTYPPYKYKIYMRRGREHKVTADVLLFARGWAYVLPDKAARKLGAVEEICRSEGFYRPRGKPMSAGGFWVDRAKFATDGQSPFESVTSLLLKKLSGTSRG